MIITDTLSICVCDPQCYDKYFVVKYLNHSEFLKKIKDLF